MDKEQIDSIQKQIFDEYLRINDFDTPKNDIYHYTSFEGFNGIVSNQKIWFSDIYNLNDKSEVSYAYEIIQEAIKNLHSKLNGALYLKIKSRCNFVLKPIGQWNINNKQLEQQTFIASFCLNKDNLPMWVYYTKSGNYDGVNINFDKKKLEEEISNRLNGKDMMASGKVIYEKKQQLKIIEEFLITVNEIYEPNDKINNFIIKILQVIAMFFKHPGFKTEKEYRFAYIFIDEDLKHKQLQNRKINFKNSKDENEEIIIDYIEYGYNNEAIKFIYTSPTLKSEKKLDELKRIITKELKNVYIKKSEIPLRY